MALIGRALLTGCEKMTCVPGYLLRFEQPELFPKPIPCRGSMNYFHLPREISQRLPARYPYAF
jgi:hypothetical protein